jgi:hypothetical protein
MMLWYIDIVVILRGYNKNVDLSRLIVINLQVAVLEELIVTAD